METRLRYGNVLYVRTRYGLSMRRLAVKSKRVQRIGGTSGKRSK